MHRYLNRGQNHGVSEVLSVRIFDTPHLYYSGAQTDTALAVLRLPGVRVPVGEFLEQPRESRIVHGIQLVLARDAAPGFAAT